MHKICLDFNGINQVYDRINENVEGDGRKYFYYVPLLPDKNNRNPLELLVQYKTISKKRNISEKELASN